MSKTTKSSSGDIASVNPYNYINVGKEVITWKIIRIEGKLAETKPYKKRL